jgi:hypothetical protein
MGRILEKKSPQMMPAAGWGQPLAKKIIYLISREYLVANTDMIVLETRLGWGERIRTKVIIPKLQISR